jgi:S1-C subfamily serine protease
MHGPRTLRSAPIALAVSALLAFVLFTPPAAAAPAQSESPPPASRPQSHLTVDSLSVVKVRSRAIPDARSASTLGVQREGTGVVIDADGLVITIGYLVLEAESVELSTADGRAFPAKVIGYDHVTGFGLLRPLGSLPISPAQIGQSSSVADRDQVFIVGFDGVAPAYVVSRRPFVGYWEYMLDEAIYTAPVTVNWAGAALLDRNRKLIGIGSLAVPDAPGADSQVPGNMFVPIDLLKPLLGDLVARGRSSAPSRPWLGVYTQDTYGNVIVTRVSAESPAEKAALRPGDVIVAVDGKTVSGQADFYSRLWGLGKAGVDVPLDVLRGGRIQRVKVRSVERETYYRPKPTY